MPRLSVILPVHNGGELLHSALSSIFAQTFVDFEVIVVDDGSTDGTPAYLSSITDVRLRVFRTEHIGITGALNHGLAEATGEYIARQDADDLSHPDRLALQVGYLDSHPEVALVGAQAAVHSSLGRLSGGIFVPTSSLSIQWRLLFDNAIVHSLAMFRRTLILEMGGYHISGAEDYDLWSRIGRLHEVANLPFVLLSYHASPTGLQTRNAEEIESTGLVISVANIEPWLHGSRWAAYAANVAGFQRMQYGPSAKDVIAGAQALLYLRYRFLQDRRLSGQGGEMKSLPAGDQVYIDFYVWRLIATAALLHASVPTFVATCRLWQLSRPVRPSRPLCAALAVLLVVAVIFGGARQRWVLHLAEAAIGRRALRHMRLEEHSRLTDLDRLRQPKSVLPSSVLGSLTQR